MIQRLHILLAIAALVVTASSCNTSKETTAISTANPPLVDALLWKISKKGLASDSYLYGTIHIIGSDDYFLPDGTLSAIGDSDKMIFEIDMNEMSDVNKQMGLLNKAFMNDNKTLKDLLSDQDYAVVEDHFKTMGLPIFMLERIKPMFLSVFAMGGDIDMGGLQNGNLKSYEMEFMELAKLSNMPVAGLETIDYQISVFDSIPYVEQANMLVDMIKTSSTGSEQFAEMMAMYKGQKINEMAGSLQDDPSGMGDYEDVLLRKRNENWIPIMEQEMTTQPTFFAVGAAHLAGSHGVIPLLIKRGYTLTPVSSPSK